MYRHFPNPDLSRELWPFAFDRQDGAHDEAHLLRVWHNVEKIMQHEGGDRNILMAATILHDCVWVDKSSPERSRASHLAAQQADIVLRDLGWTAERRDRVCHAIEAHSYSAAIAPESLEAKILQDADRLDAIGFIGVARCFYLAGQRGAALYNTADPVAEHRALDETAWALDHFQTKLLKLGEGFQTVSGKEMASARSAHLRHYFMGLLGEISATPLA